MKRNGGDINPIFISTITVLLAVINRRFMERPRIYGSTAALSSETVNSNISAAEVQQTPGCYNSTVPAYGIKNSQVTPAVVQLSGCWLQTDNGGIEGIAGGIKYCVSVPLGQ